MNRRGQFSIIAALLVAVVLVAAVMTTYATIRYGYTDGSSQNQQPQILSSIDETNLGLKEILGFTVGYYGSILKVTGNVTYAQQLAKNYLQSGLNNIGDVRPQWGANICLNNLTLTANWFSNRSFSEGSMDVSYNLTGQGIYGASYNTSARLDAQILDSPATNQAELVILRDEAQPLINLGRTNLKFYQYNYTTSTWSLTEPESIASYANGTYVLGLPQNVSSSSYVIEVSDTRGLMVEASSFTQFTSALSWNTTGFRQGYLDYVNSTNLLVGAQSNFAAQQSGPDGVYDTLTEQPYGLAGNNYYPQTYNLKGSTTLASGALSALQGNDGTNIQFHSYASSFGALTTFGYQTQGGTSVQLNNIKGSRFTCTAGGQANSISAYLNSTTISFGINSGTGSGYSIVNTFRGQSVTSPATSGVAQSITAYILCGAATNVQGAIYDSTGHLVAITEEKLIPSSTGLQTFNFLSPPTLLGATNYVLVVCAQSGSGTVELGQSNGNGGRSSTGQTYGTWPASVTFSTGRQFNICCNYYPSFNAQAAIYSSNGATLVGTTEEKSLCGVNGWVTFNFPTQPVLSQSTDYVLVVWSSDTSTVNVVSDVGSAERFQGTGTYHTWPAAVTDQSAHQTYSIYCTYAQTTHYTAQVEFAGTSDSLTWQQLIWTVDSAVSAGTADLTLQLYDASTGQYPTAGNGFMEQPTLGTADAVQTQTVTTSPEHFRNSTTGWKLLVKAVSTAATPFDLKLDFAQYNPQFTNYALNVEERWFNVNASNIRQDLCIKTGSLGAEPLLVQVYHANTWQTLTALLPNFFNNVSLAPYIDSQNLTIRFVGSNDTKDPSPDTWLIDSVYLKDEADPNYLIKLQQSTFNLEVLQNGTIRTAGQNLVTTQTIPVPPIPVKALHLNETINGVNQEVPFQIEDWASSYQIPLGLTSNTTVFSNRQMIVLLLNSAVSDFTVWWNGSDTATQTSLAYTNRFFTADNTAASKYSNGNLTLVFSGGMVGATVAGTGTYSNATFMRVNSEASTYGSGTSLVIHHGVVRDVAMEEAEWGGAIGGADGCPNMYANIIITLPANATYYNYQLRLMFITSSQARTINDLCPIKLTTSLTSPVLQAENGTLADFPLVANGTATYTNTASPGYTDHHFMQFILGNGTKGAGIMFGDTQNLRLYAFDTFPLSTSKGALRTSTNLLELLPVSSGSVAFRSAYDITWQGAVATFDTNNTPICNLYDATTPMGLWILAEYPPTLTVTAKS